MIREAAEVLKDHECHLEESRSSGPYWVCDSHDDPVFVGYVTSHVISHQAEMLAEAGLLCLEGAK